MRRFLIDSGLAAFVLSGALSAHDSCRAKCECRTQARAAPTQTPVMELLTKLKDAHPRVREAAANSLATEDGKTLWKPKPQDPIVVQGLIEAVKDPDVRVRTAALRAIELMGKRARTAGPALVEALRDSDYAVRWCALRALERSGADVRSALPALIAIVKRGDGNSAIAARLLAQLGPEVPAAIPSMIEELGRVPPPARRYGPCGGPTNWSTVTNNLLQVGPAVIPHLMEVLTDGKRDGWLRAGAAFALGRFGSAAEPAVPVLLEAVKDKSTAVPYYALQSLQQIDPASAPKADPAYKVLLLKFADYFRGMWLTSWFTPSDRELIAALIEAFGDRPLPAHWQDGGMPEVNIATALVRIGPECLAPLQAAASHPNSSVRGRAAVYLGIVGRRQFSDQAQQIAPTILKVLEDDDPQVRAAAVFGLQLIGSKAGNFVPVWLDRLVDPDPTVRRTAVRALGAIEPLPQEVAAGLVGALEDEHSAVRRSAAEALAKAGTYAVPALLKALKHEDPLTRRAAAAALEKTPNAEQAMSALVQALTDHDAHTREAAARAIARSGAPANDAVPALIELLQDRTYLSGMFHRPFIAALFALEKIGPDARAAVPHLTDLLKYDDPSVRGYTADALGAIGPAAKPAVPALIEMFKDGDDYARGSAIKALGGIGPAARDAVPALTEAARHEPVEWIRQEAMGSLRKIGR